MSRYIRYIVLALLTLVLLTVALANRALVTFSVLPDDIAVLLGWQWRIDVPLYIVLALGAVFGLLLGFVWEWLREYKHRKVARVQTRAVSKLERELAAMKDQTSLPDDEVLAMLEKPRAR
ncbi:MAG: LapA family protein [Cypionkella sp.]